METNFTRFACKKKLSETIDTSEAHTSMFIYYRNILQESNVIQFEYLFGSEIIF